MANLFAELRRRNVFRVAGVYAVAGWLLAQAAVLIEAPLSLPSWFDTLVLVILLLGFPVALILAWAFEMTPEGVKLTANVPEGESIAPKTGRKLDYAILAGIGLVAALFVAGRLMPAPFVTPGAPQDVAVGGAAQHAPSEAASAPGAFSKDAKRAPPPAASIAVLPFTDLSPGKDQEYFSDGIAEEILNVLARIEGLKVASRTSSFQFRETARGIPAIAGDLGVRHVLEGSVRRSGDAIRVTAQLIDAGTDAHLWSQTFDRPLSTETVFAIQDEIANAIVAALRERIGLEVAKAPTAVAPTENDDAYELFLKARARFQARRDLDAADAMLAEALAIDPNFADALAIRAAILNFGGEYGGQSRDDRATRAEGRALIDKALAIDKENSLAHAINALSHFTERQEGGGSADWAAILAGYERALELDPMNANALNWQGITLAYLGDNEKAAAVHRRCVAVDPALSACRSNLAIELIGLGRKNEAAGVLDAAIDAGAFAVGPGQMVLLAELKRRDAFLLLSLNVPGLRGYRKFNALYAAISEPGADPAVAAEIKALFAENKASSRAYTLLNALGDYERPALIVAYGGDIMAGYRRSPAFKAHMRASGAYDYWRKHGFPPQCKAKGRDDFECR